MENTLHYLGAACIALGGLTGCGDDMNWEGQEEIENIFKAENSPAYHDVSRVLGWTYKSGQPFNWSADGNRPLKFYIPSKDDPFPAVKIPPQSPESFIQLSQYCERNSDAIMIHMNSIHTVQGLKMACEFIGKHKGGLQEWMSHCGLIEASKSKWASFKGNGSIYRDTLNMAVNNMGKHLGTLGSTFNKYNDELCTQFAR